MPSDGPDDHAVIRSVYLQVAQLLVLALAYALSLPYSLHHRVTRYRRGGGRGSKSQKQVRQGGAKGTGMAFATDLSITLMLESMKGDA